MTRQSTIQEPEIDHSGSLFVISAPSGAGKTTLIGHLLKRIPDMAYSVSHTTRKPRRNETHGIDYYFVSRKEFLDGIREGVWAEWAEVHGNYYGTAVSTIQGHLDAGKDVIMDIDVQGAKQIQNKYPDCVSIFLDPPSLTALKERLIRRNADSDESMKHRLENAQTEMAQKHLFDHVVVNDRLDIAVEEVFELITRHRGQR